MRSVARWIGAHTFQQGSTSEIAGAYPAFNHLRQAVLKSKGSEDTEALSSKESKGLYGITLIDLMAKKLICVNEGNLPSKMASEEVRFLSGLSLNHLKALRESSTENRSVVNRILDSKNKF